jgi:hypothetical protein
MSRSYSNINLKTLHWLLSYVLLSQVSDKPEAIDESANVRDLKLVNDSIVFYCFRLNSDSDEFEPIEYENYWDQDVVKCWLLCV